MRAAAGATAVLAGSAPAELFGACARCGVVHRQTNDAAAAGAALQALFHGLAFDGAYAADRAHLQAARGKMIGVLVGTRADHTPVTLRAFSGDLDGHEEQPGWAQALVRRADTAGLQAQTSATIRAADAQLLTAPPHTRAALQATRRHASQQLMTAMIDAVVLQSRGGARLSLRHAFAQPAPKRIPAGTADCVLPKLLHSAHLQQLAVRGVAEAWWGPPQGDRVHGALQAPCAERCEPILGFLLCPAP